MTKLETSAELLTALRDASTRELSAKELHSQRVSFIMGAIKEESGITRMRVEEVLARQDGLKNR